MTRIFGYQSEFVNDKAYALLGYPMKPAHVVVAKVSPPDGRTESFCELSDGTRIFRSLVFKSKPRLRKITDEYGVVTKWIGRQY